MKTKSMNDEEFEKYIASAKKSDNEKVNALPKELLDMAKKVYGIEDENELAKLVERDLEEFSDENDFSKADDYNPRVEEIQNDWLRQGKVLESVIPGFKLEEAFANPDFVRCVAEENKTLIEAYAEIMKKRPRRAISEVGNLSNGIGGNIRHDVKSMSDSEFDEYIKKIKNS